MAVDSEFEQAAVRAVVTCPHCNLVQFMPKRSEMCRRCGKPLVEEQPEQGIEEPLPDEAGKEALPFAEVVRELRAAAHLSQRQLAGRMECPRSYISKIENGAASPTHASVVRLAHALGLKGWELLKLAEERAEHHERRRAA